MRPHFCKKGFALSLVMKVRVFGTRKRPIQFNSGNVNGLRDLIDTLDTGFVNFYGHRFGTGKENVIQDSYDRSSGCGFLGSKGAGIRTGSGSLFPDPILRADCLSRAGPFCQDRPVSTLKLRDNPAGPVTWNRGHVIGVV